MISSSREHGRVYPVVSGDQEARGGQAEGTAQASPQAAGQTSSGTAGRGRLAHNRRPVPQMAAPVALGGRPGFLTRGPLGGALAELWGPSWAPPGPTPCHSQSGSWAPGHGHPSLLVPHPPSSVSTEGQPLVESVTPLQSDPGSCPHVSRSVSESPDSGESSSAPPGPWSVASSSEAFRRSEPGQVLTEAQVAPASRGLDGGATSLPRSAPAA